ncbi:arginine--tRNA ligase, partial [Flavobacteriaceae bacterium]|nr:arginine--tRNA ligase [Flavobacteriaceae bacterium]
MKALSDQLSPAIATFLAASYTVDITDLEFQQTRKEFAGDITLVVFSLLRSIKANPVSLGNEIGAYLVSEINWITDFNVVKGFLNLSIADEFYVAQLNDIAAAPNYGHLAANPDKGVALVEYSSPNTNKPL